MSEDQNGVERSSAFTNNNVPQNYRKFLEPYVYEPWARRLVEVASLEEGHAVLDVASGTGIVARTAARKVGSMGRVIASDISPVMIATIENDDTDGAPINTLECPANGLKVKDRSFDRVFCQHGLSFISDRVGAIREMRRAVRYSGIVCVSVWSGDHPSEPFETYLDVMKKYEVAPPYPNAYETNTYTMSEAGVREIFEEAGFSRISVRTDEIELSWPDKETAAAGLSGTPFGPVISKLDPELRDELIQEIASRFEDRNRVTRMTKSVIARAVA